MTKMVMPMRKMPKTVYILPCGGKHYYCSKKAALYRCKWVQADEEPGDPCLILNCSGPVEYVLNERPEMEPRDWDTEPPKGMQHP